MWGLSFWGIGVRAWGTVIRWLRWGYRSRLPWKEVSVIRNLTIVFVIILSCLGALGTRAAQPSSKDGADDAVSSKVAAPAPRAVSFGENFDKRARRRDVRTGIGSRAVGQAPSPHAKGIESKTLQSGSVSETQACQAHDNSLARISDRSRFYVIDDFVPADSGTTSTVVWRGAYAVIGNDNDCASSVVSDAFHVKYYRDAGGVPGLLIGWFVQEDSGLPDLNVVSRVSTGGLIAGIAEEFEYTATHNPLELDAGQCYWIEITNAPTLSKSSDCVWQWEVASPTNELAMQSVEDEQFLTNDWIFLDFAFCLDLPLDDPGICVPPPPENDDCEGAVTVTETGPIAFDNTFARTDPTAHGLCTASDTADFDADLWYCWTAPCNGSAFVSTCGLTDLDTRVAVYEGCGVCPPSEVDLISCNDDRCGEVNAAFQSLAAFTAVQGRQYTVRAGVFPDEVRGAGMLTLECDPPTHESCPNFGNCREAHDWPGCETPTCCNLVCACDPFCCETTWDVSCATTGSNSAPGCGAQILCTPCGSPSSGDCCTATPGISGCSNTACCLAVCNADGFCCESQWDENCATNGVGGNGNGAEVLCPNLCGASSCPDVAIEWLEPELDLNHEWLDARQPFPPTDDSMAQGISSVLVAGPAEAAVLNCWEACASGAANSVSSVTVESIDRIRIELAHPISPGAATRISYLGNASTATLIFHPGNVNGGLDAGAGDVVTLIDELNGTFDQIPMQREDIDRSGRLGAGDLLRLIDLLQKNGVYAPGWNNTSKPTAPDPCIQ